MTEPSASEVRDADRAFYATCDVVGGSALFEVCLAFQDTGRAIFVRVLARDENSAKSTAEIAVNGSWLTVWRAVAVRVIP